ncbi:MAG TPA: PilN domain-containing protein [Dehalococcoidales bacterium]|nr:PilN domain-containing protein [Dehalococcoidales bacterium]
MRITTLNISSKAIRYAAVQNSVVTAWGTEPLASPIRNGLILEPDELGLQIKAMLASSKISADRVIYSLNGLPFSFRLFSLPEMDEESLNEAIIRMVRKEMPLAPEDMYISWRAYPGGDEGKQYLVTGIARRPVDALRKMSAVAGIKSSALYLPHVTLTHLTERTESIVIDFEPDCSSLTLIVDGVPVGMHTVPASGAEASLADMASNLARELNRMVGFYNDSHPNAPVEPTTPVLLTGEPAGVLETISLIQEKTPYPIEVLKRLPGSSLTVPSDLPLAAYAVNIACVIHDSTNAPRRGSEPTFKEIDMASAGEERAKAPKKPTSWLKKLFWGAVAVGVIALVSGAISQFQAMNTISQLEQSLNLSQQTLTQKQSSVKQFQQTESLINQKLASKQKLDDELKLFLNQRETVADMDLITRSFPASTYFTTIDVGSEQITINGVTTIQEKVVEYIRTLENSGSFKSVEIEWIKSNGASSVAFMITIDK